MSAVSFPVQRPAGRVLLVGNLAGRTEALAALGDLGFTCEESDDPYSAFVELCARPLAFSAIVLSLSSLYREELQIVPSVLQRFPHLDVWLAQSEGRNAAVNEALRLGADGLLSRGGLHRMGIAGQNDPKPPTGKPPLAAYKDKPSREPVDFEEDLTSDFREAMPRVEESETSSGEPLLTAEELRALLQDPGDDRLSLDDR